MTHSQYVREGRRLREVLKDAVDRGDYHLEMDVKEALVKLQDKYNQKDDNEDHL